MFVIVELVLLSDLIIMPTVTCNFSFGYKHDLDLRCVCYGGYVSPDYAAVMLSSQSIHNLDLLVSTLPFSVLINQC